MSIGKALSFVGLARKDRWKDGYEISGLGLLLFWVAIVGAICYGLVTGIVQIARTTGHTTCIKWGQQTGYKTHFRIMHTLDGGSCFAQLPNGHWVSTKNVQFIAKIGK